MTDNTLFKCFEDATGNLWFTCYNGTITIYDIETKTFRPYERNEWLKSKVALRGFVHYLGFSEGDVYFFYYKNYLSPKLKYEPNVNNIEWGNPNENKSYIVRSNGELDSISYLDLRSVERHRLENLQLVDRYKKTIMFKYRLCETDNSSDTAGLADLRRVLKTEANYQQPVIKKIEGDYFVGLPDGLAKMHKGNLEYIYKGLAVSHFSYSCDLLWITTINNGVFLLSSDMVKEISSDLALLPNEKLLILRKLKSNIIAVTNRNRVFTISESAIQVGSLDFFTSKANQILYNPYYSIDSSKIYTSAMQIFFDSEGVAQLSMRKPNVEDSKLDILEYSLPPGIFIFLEKNNLKPEYLNNRDIIGDIRNWCILNGHLYIETSVGLLQFSSLSGKVTLLSIDISQTKHSVSSMHSFRDYLLVGFRGLGVGVIKNDSLIAMIDDESGLASVQIGEIAVDESRNRVWVSTNNGVSILMADTHTQELRFKEAYTLKKYNGLVFESIKNIRLVNDRIYMASETGLFRVRADQEFKLAEAPKINGVTLQNGDSIYQNKSKVILDHDQNYITIEYSSVILQKVSKPYRYRLHSDDDANMWIETNEREVSFSFLPSGDYSFEVCARAVNSKWGDSESFEFTIKPHFSELWWVRSFGIILLGFAGFMLFTFRQRRLAEKSKLLLSNQDLALQVSRLESSSLRSQMNPHFIFNVLNSIQKLILKEEKENANKLLSRFSKLVRSSLLYSRLESISLEDEVAFLENYLNIEAQRFPGRFTYHIDVADELLADTMLPPLLIQPLCENCIKHAFVQDGGIINVNISEQNDHLHILVEDNGIGVENTNTSKNGSLGTVIIRDRIALLRRSGQKASLTIEIANKQTNKGTKAILTLPYN